MIISFTRTTEALLDGTKTVTRREWKHSHATKFRASQIVDAYDKLPRVGGKRIAKIQLTRRPYCQPLRNMPNDHFEREGGTRYWKDKADFIESMGGPDKWYWVIEFELIATVSRETDSEDNDGSNQKV